jgi:hypothetical protein
MKNQTKTTTPAIVGGDLIVASGLKEHDEIQSKISAFNFSKGLKTIMQGAWTYDKLAKNAATKMNISFKEAYKLGVDKLLSNAN